MRRQPKRRYPRRMRERYELNQELRLLRLLRRLGQTTKYGLSKAAFVRACLSPDGLNCLKGEIVRWTRR